MFRFLNKIPIFPSLFDFWPLRFFKNFDFCGKFLFWPICRLLAYFLHIVYILLKFWLTFVYFFWFFSLFFHFFQVLKVYYFDGNFLLYLIKAQNYKKKCPKISFIIFISGISHFFNLYPSYILSYILYIIYFTFFTKNFLKIFIFQTQKWIFWTANWILY